MKALDLQTQYDAKYRTLEEIRAKLSGDLSPVRMAELILEVEKIVNELAKIQLQQLNEEGADL